MENKVYGLLINTDVYEDVTAAADWYETQRQGHGKVFALRFQEAVSLLTTHPHIYQLVFQHFRRVILNPFPYAIFYGIDEQEKMINIVAVIHTKRGDEFIAERLKLK
jgi:toxin ParE1/3/4